jgi:hypothetical protein
MAQDNHQAVSQIPKYAAIRSLGAPFYRKN